MSIPFYNCLVLPKKDVSNFKKVLTFYGLYDIILISYPRFKYAHSENIIIEGKRK